MKRLAWFVLMVGFLQAACTNGDAPVARRRVLIDEMVRLRDGSTMSWKLEPGFYRLDLTASGDGAAVEWIGARCEGVGQTKTFSGECLFERTGQLVVSNPTSTGLSLGLGSEATVTVHIEAIPHGSGLQLGGR